MKFLGVATILDLFLKAYKASEIKGFSPTKGLTVQTSLIVRIASKWSLFQQTEKSQHSRKFSTIIENLLLEELINKMRWKNYDFIQF